MRELSPIEWAVRPLKKYADFNGRAPRAEYWWFYLGSVVVQIPLSIIDKAFGEWSPLSNLFGLAIRKYLDPPVDHPEFVLIFF